MVMTMKKNTIAMKKNVKNNIQINIDISVK